VVIAVGRKSLNFAKEHAQGHPIVFCMVLGISNADLSKSVTGVPLEPDAKAVLEDLRELSSTFQRIGFLYNPKTSEVLATEASRAAKTQGVTLIAIAVASAEELKGAIQKLGDVNALWLPPDPKLFSKEVFSLLLSLSAERHVPLIGFLDSLTQAGALASISPNYGDNGVRAGKLAAELLARPEGRRLPVPGPVFAPGNLTINLQTAQALGVSVSAKAIASATQVIR
jgi:putative ABC transport system substrate-binding protein